MRSLSVLCFGLCLVLALYADTRQAHAQRTGSNAVPNAAIATFVLRTSTGQPVQGALCLIDSAMWRVPFGQTSATVATGETDSAGRVAFAVADWPNAPYRIRFQATDHMQPHVPIFDATEEPWPITAQIGGRRLTTYLVLDPEGHVFGDAADGHGPPVYKPTYGGDGPRPGQTPYGMTTPDVLRRQTMIALMEPTRAPDTGLPAQVQEAIGSTPVPHLLPTQTPPPDDGAGATCIAAFGGLVGTIGFVFGRKWLYAALGIVSAAQPRRPSRPRRTLQRGVTPLTEHPRADRVWVLPEEEEW